MGPASGSGPAGGVGGGGAGSGGVAGAGGGRRGRRTSLRGRSAGERLLEPLDALVHRRPRWVDLRPGGAQQRQLHGHPGLVALADCGDRRRELVDGSEQRHLAEAVGLLGDPGLVLGDDEEVIGDLAERGDHQELAQVSHEVGREPGGIVTGAGERGADPQGRGAVAGGDRLGGAEQELGIGDAEHGEDIVGRDLVAAVGHELIEGAERIPEAAVGGPGDRADGTVVDDEPLRLGGAPEHDRDLVRGGAAEVEALAAVDDRRHHLVGLGGGEHEDGVRGRLLERLQEGVPGFAGQHVRLVEDVDLRRALRRRVSDPLAEVADVVDRTV